MKKYALIINSARSPRLLPKAEDWGETLLLDKTKEKREDVGLRNYGYSRDHVSEKLVLSKDIADGVAIAALVTIVIDWIAESKEPSGLEIQPSVA